MIVEFCISPPALLTRFTKTVPLGENSANRKREIIPKQCHPG
jgi:hypothetical protein